MSSKSEDATRVESGLLLDNLILESRKRMYEDGKIPCTELVIAGPACTGKTRFAAYAAGMLRYSFVEGDLFHLHRVMELARKRSIPMTDEYRESEWISAIAGGLLFRRPATHGSCFDVLCAKTFISRDADQSGIANRHGRFVDRLDGRSGRRIAPPG